MSLLVDIMTDTLDGAYAERVGRTARPPGAVPPDGRRRARHGVIPVVVLLGLGLLTGTAVAQVRDRQDATTGLRAELADEVRDRTRASDALALRAQELRREVAAVQDAALSTDARGRRVTAELTALGLATGTLPVRGPGIVVTVDDAPGELEGDESSPAEPASDGVVQDRDLQRVVNGLWAAGAEAVAVNEQRLTALTAIRSAGPAVLVDLLPVTPPYVIRAIGKPENLEVEFGDGPGGRWLNTLRANHGITFDIRRDDTLSLPGAAAPELPAAAAGSPAGGTPGGEEGSP